MARNIIAMGSRQVLKLLVVATLIAAILGLIAPPSVFSQTALEVASATPTGPGATISSKIVITFNQPIVPASFAGAIDGAPMVPTQIMVGAGGSVVTVDPGELEYGRTYQASVAAGVQASGGATLGSAYNFNFTTQNNPNPKRPTTTISLPSGPLEAGQTYTISGQASGYTWQRDAGNPLELRHWNVDGIDTGDRPMLHPAAMYFPDPIDGYKFWLSYTPYPPASDENPVMVRSNDGVNFTAVGVPKNPLFTYNYQPPYDMQNLADPELYRLGNTWMLFYEMETPPAVAGEWMKGGGYIGVALSADGKTWEPYGGPYTYNPANPPTGFPANGNPVIVPEPGDSGGYKTGEIGVFFKDGQYHLWRTTIGSGLTVDYDTAPDPRGPWTNHGAAVQFGAYYYGPHPDVVYDAERDIYLMLYLGPSGDELGQLGFYTATSPAGPWAPHPLNPVFRAQGGWEANLLYRASMAKVDGQWYMYYSGNSASNPQIGLAREVPGVRRVEVSTNGGSTWQQATLNADGTWNFNWTPATTGSYTVTARVTDDFMQGDPAAGVNVSTGQGQLSSPTAPILVLKDSNYSSNPFGSYLAELLKAEGLVEFQQAERAALMADSNPLTYLRSFKTLFLAEMALNATEEQLLRDYVSGGGTLIAMRPDRDLADLFGLTYVGARPEQLLQFFKVDTSSEAGAGIVNLSIQYHGQADNYNLNGATPLANLWNDINTASGNPAVTSMARGSGQAIAFSFDLAKSVVLTRQGNPAWKESEGDNLGGYRPGDLFFRANGDKWLAPERTRVPQADEAQRFLANLVLSTTGQPLPRLWYLPAGNKVMMINTGDAEGMGGTSLDNTINAAASYGGSYTSYLMESGISSTDPAKEAAWRAAGHEQGPHVYGGGPDTCAAIRPAYQNIVNSLQAKFGHGAATARSHTIDWCGWVDMAAIEAEFGTGMDTNYYHYLPQLLPYGANANGYFTGSALPQRFSDESGNVLPIYQAATQWPDEWFDDNGFTAAQTAQIIKDMFTAAQNGYYSAFVANIHHVRYDNAAGDITQAWANQIWAYARDNGIPMWSAEKLLNFVKARDAANLSNINWNGAALSYDFATPFGGQNLTLMVPGQASGGQLQSVTLNGNPVATSMETIKGRTYALFTTNTTSAHVVASYGQDTAAPVISAVQATNVGDSAATVAWTTDEPATSLVNWGTESSSQPFSQTVAGHVTAHSVQLSGLQPVTQYYYKVTSVDAAGNPSSSNVMSFTTGLPRWVETTAADFADGTLAGVAVSGAGALTLGTATGFSDQFEGTSLDSTKWLARNIAGGATTVSVANGAVTVNAATYIRTNQTFFHETVEGLVTLSAGPNAHFGWATTVQAGDDGIADPHWMIFSSRDGQISARTRLNDGQGAGGEIITPLPDIAPGVPHTFKVVWKSDNSIEFWVDGYLKTTHNRAFTEPMRVYLTSNLGQAASADWVSVVGAYAAGGSYISSIFDSGGNSGFQTLLWVGSTPSGTVTGFETRTSSDGQTWSSWAPVPGNGTIASPAGRYLQYRASLSTTNPTLTPRVDEVAVTYQPADDTSPPIVAGTVPANGAVGVAVDGNITISYSEAIQQASFSASAGGISFSTSFEDGNRRVVLNPSASLDHQASYTVTVAAGVRDGAGNATTAPYSFSFTTAEQTSGWVETTVADFSDGTLAGTRVTSSGDGEVALAPVAFTDSFTQADGAATNWDVWPSSHQPSSTPVWGVVGNAYAHEVNSSVLSYHPSMAKPAYTPSGDFSLRARQRFTQIETGGAGVLGFVVGGQDDQHYYFVQYAADFLKLYKYVAPASYTLVAQATLAGPALNQWYDMRIDLAGSTFNVYIDNTLGLTATDTSYLPGRVGLLGYGGSRSEYDDVQITGQIGTNGVYTSSVFDAGGSVDARTLTWVGQSPTGSGMSFEARAAATPGSVDGASWVAVAPDGTLSGVAGRYLQYRVTLSRQVSAQAPILEQVVLEYVLLASDTTPPVVSSATPTGTGVPVDTNLTITFSEVINQGTFAATINGVQVSSGEVSFAEVNARTVVTINPTASLVSLTDYTVIVPATVSDLAGNQLGTLHQWAFTTAQQQLAWTETTEADFADGSMADTLIKNTGGGQVTLANGLIDHFTGAALDPARWTAGHWTGSTPAVAVAGGAVSVSSLSFIKSVPTFNQSVAEGWVRFDTGGVSQNFGVADTLNAPCTFMVIGPASAGAMRVETYDSDRSGGSLNSDQTTLLPSFHSIIGDGQFHYLKIQWTATEVRYYIDDPNTPVAIHTGFPRALDGAYSLWMSASSGTMAADRISAGQYAPSGSYDSSVFDAGGTNQFDQLSSTGSQPVGTTVAFSTRTSPDGTAWSGWQPIGAGGAVASPAGRYIQYRAALSTSDGTVTPTVDQVVVAYHEVTAPTNSPPVAQAGTGTMSHRASAGADITLSAADQDSDPLTYSLVGAHGGATHGTVGLSGNTAHYTPSGDFVGSDSFQFKANDGKTDSNTATVTVTLTNAAPTASVSLSPSSPSVSDTISASALGSDADGDTVALGYAWKRNSVLVGGQAASTYSGTKAAGDTLRVEVTPNDGHADGLVASAEVTLSTTGATQWTQTTQADFEQCSSYDNVMVTRAADGEITLTPALYDHFDGSGLGSAWTSGPWGAGTYSPSLTGSVITHTNPGGGAYVRSTASSEPGTGQPTQVLEARLKFSKGGNTTAPYLYLAFAGDGLSNWIGFGTGYTGDQLYTSVYPGAGPYTSGLGDLFDQWHDYKIVWKVASIDFYVDGVLRHTENRAMAGPKYVYFSAGGSTPVGSSLAADWVRVNSYAALTGSLTSCVHDSNRLADWLSLEAVTQTPSGTSVTFETRSGDTQVPDGAWSAWQPLGTGGAIASPNGRYIQYRAALSTADGTITPVIEQVSIGYLEVTTPTNRTPVAVADSFSTPEDTALNVAAADGVLKNDTDADNDSLTAVLVSGPTNGTLALNPDGSFSYTPAPNWSGPDGFSYRASDGTAESEPAMVSIAVGSANDLPTISDIADKTIDEDTATDQIPFTVGDQETPAASLTVTGSSANSLLLPNAAIVFGGGGADRTVMLTPAPGQSGTATVTITVSDGTLSASDSFVLTVVATNDAPVAVADGYTVAEDSTLTVAAADGALKNDTDADGDSLTAEKVSDPTHGTLAFNPDGSFTYTPVANWSGADSFTYKAKDGTAESAAATVTIIVTPVNDAPSLGAIGNKEVDELTLLAFTASATDLVDPADTLTFSLVGAPAGAAINGSTGAFTWTPTEAQGPGSYTFKVRVTDSGSPAMWDEDEITVAVAEVNQAPVLAAIGAKTVAWGSELSFAATASDPDLPANTLAYRLEWAGGTAPQGVSFNASTGAFSWTPTAAQVGSHTVTVRVADSGSPVLDDTETITITVGKRSSALAYSGDISAQYSDLVALKATLTDSGGGSLQGQGLAGKTVTFTLGDQSTTAVTDGSGVAAATLTLNQAAKATQVTSTFAADVAYLASGDTDAFAIKAEDARITFHGGNPVAIQVVRDRGNSGAFSLTATVRELYPDLPEGKGAAGDIAKANPTLRLVPVGGGASPEAKCSWTPSGTGYDARLTGVCQFNDVPVDSYVVEVKTAAGNYDGLGEDVLTVYDPSLGYAMGGGKLTWQGDEVHFGFTMEYTKRGTNVKGKFALVRVRPDGTSYRVKSNSLYGLALGESQDPAVPMGWASFSGKATYQEPTWADAKGNHEFMVYVEDRNNPGNGTDKFWFEIKDQSGKVIDSISIPREAQVNAVALTDGDIVAPHKAGTTVTPPKKP